MKGFSVALLISLVAVASAYPKDRCVCTFMFLPLCASNGVTYANKCEFECDKRKEFNKDLTILHGGECEEKINDLSQAKDACFCTFEFFPVCGSDGVTYSNPCSFQCIQKKNQNLQMLHAGQCEEKSTENVVQTKDACFCTKELLPVCGSDGVTYSNQCTFQCNKKKNQNLQMLHAGQCEDKIAENFIHPENICVCTKEFFPVCGSDGVTYSNQCHFQCIKKKFFNEDLKIVHNGRCKETVQSKDVCACTKEFLPICGSDGVTYSNKCTFQCSKKSANQDMYIAYVGPC